MVRVPGSSPTPRSCQTRTQRATCYDQHVGTPSERISRQQVEHVAALACLGLTDDELDRMQSQLSRILEAIEALREVDTSHIGPTAQVIALENVMRDDVASPPMRRPAVLANAPLREDPFVRVPTVLEEGR
jgi:aspartyl-tRNA(Asn)/glutamyl-tRNA(Gln) amidotransferase subunit C